MIKVNIPKLVMLALLGVLLGSFVWMGGCIGSAGNELKTETQIIAEVTPEEANALIQDNKDSPNFTIIDVRTPEEYATGHIEKAMNLDYNSEIFRADINKLEKSKMYLIYCRSGHRSGLALSIMKELGFTEVYNMLGGIIEWEASGLPTVK
ncbi:rhodanese-like domain-containing protein [Chloroflexota bacterium]